MKTFDPQGVSEFQLFDVVDNNGNSLYEFKPFSNRTQFYELTRQERKSRVVLLTRQYESCIINSGDDNNEISPVEEMEL